MSKCNGPLLKVHAWCNEQLFLPSLNNFLTQSLDELFAHWITETKNFHVANGWKRGRHKYGTGEGGLWTQGTEFTRNYQWMEFLNNYAMLYIDEKTSKKWQSQNHPWQLKTTIGRQKASIAPFEKSLFESIFNGLTSLFRCIR